MEGAQPMAGCLYSPCVKVSQLFLSKSQFEPIAQTLGLALGACFITKSGSCYEQLQHLPALLTVQNAGWF